MVKEHLWTKATAIDGLNLLLEHYYGREAKSVVDMEGMATRLSKIVFKEPTWQWRYIRNVLSKSIDPSKKMIQAIQILCLALDDIPELLARSKDITGLPLRILVSEKIAPNTVIMTSSRRCKNPKCIMSFTKRGPNHFFCSLTCRKQVQKLKREEKRNG